ncbi:hypothetical protein DSO57_1028916 [Entomophthora muscae]|uniref:Uncharacterized protein n=1 Tax=Entomophthora muscae TaxID=34485 RepID=A0ACC2TCG9_9FUNG|nr:hypothetical protein DSO57_1028916 [Entomophthora muscae]
MNCVAHLTLLASCVLGTTLKPEPAKIIYLDRFVTNVIKAPCPSIPAASFDGDQPDAPEAQAVGTYHKSHSIAIKPASLALAIALSSILLL